MIRVNLHRVGGAATGRPAWAAWLAMAASVVIGVTLFLLAASLALILIPVVMIVGAVAAWRIRRRLKAAGFGQPNPFGQQQRQAEHVDVIDAEYRVIDPGEQPRR
jgi:membrane protein implicated in regulation of membrane protease activity